MAKLKLRNFLKPTQRYTNRSSINPMNLPLCQACRAWGHIGIHSLDEPCHTQDKNHTGRQFATVEQLAQAPQCVMCASVLAAYNARAQLMPDIQSRLAAEICIEIAGPFYLDSGGSGFYSPDDRSPRLADRSDPNQIVVRSFLRLTVKSLPEAKTRHESDARLSKQTDWDGEFYKHPTLFVITPQFKFIYSSDGTGLLTSIEEWDVPFFDVQLLRGWMRRCEDNHAVKCGGKGIKKEDLPTGFRVIDTLEEKITEPEGSFRYMALSYMWAVGPDNNVQLEKSNVEALTEPHSLRQVQLPNIIVDAIALCRDLGERYLWIDRLCIIQDDEVTKPKQINAMDTIYRSASCTIMGALNTRDDVGLPGCAGRPRHPRSSIWAPAYGLDVETQGLICGSTTDYAIDSTLWNQRGWTFQERLLSRRCLYITHHQVIYRCCEEEAMEVLTWAASPVCSSPEGRGHQDKDGISRKDCDNSSNNSSDETANSNQPSKDISIFKRGDYSGQGTQFTFQGGIKVSDYFDWVKDYRSRHLSFVSDAFNAFVGVSNALSESFKCRILFGIPEKYLAASLYWDSPGAFSPLGQIHNVPSWSWVSSSSAVTYDCASERLGRDFYQIASIVYFHYQQPNGDLKKLVLEERWIQHEISIEELAQRDELPPLRGKGIPGEWRTNQDWKECLQNPWTTYKQQALDPDACKVAVLFPGSLVFNTTIAYLKIGEVLTTPNDKGESNISDASLFNTNSERVGTLKNMDRTWIETHCSKVGVQKLFAFAVISGRLQEYNIRKNSAFFERYSDIWELNVMMLERLPCKSFVARRIGIGRVTMCKWKDCSPRWQTVVLC
ncbi:heterokaryon incompatibility protein-domain-containing protein [Xylaria venustula]|nr:heterokaryon incompatibility protein-domain-containing protein [Xylaria venustula]